MKQSLRVHVVFDNNIKSPGFGRPNTKIGLIVADHFGANRIAAFAMGHLEKMARLITQTTACLDGIPRASLILRTKRVHNAVHERNGTRNSDF
jgi:hypothetical protein